MSQQDSDEFVRGDGVNFKGVAHQWQGLVGSTTTQFHDNASGLLERGPTNEPPEVLGHALEVPKPDERQP